MSVRDGITRALKRSMVEAANDDMSYVMLLYNSEVDDGEIIRHGGSRPGRSKNIDRDHANGHARIYADYFAERPVYNDKLFRRRFRMRKSLFLRIHDTINAKYPFFINVVMQRVSLAYLLYRNQSNDSID